MGCHSSMEKNRLIRSESMPGHCGHLPCRMTSSGCLNTVCNSSLDFEETPGTQTSNLHRKHYSQQAWLSHVNIMQMFLWIEGLESGELDSSVISHTDTHSHKINIIITLSFPLSKAVD